MYLSSVINAPAWDKAKWSGTCMGGWGPQPFLGPMFDDEKAAITIFEEWRNNYGEDDLNKELRISIIENDSPGSHNYWVHVSGNLDNKLKNNTLREGQLLMAMSRYNQMTPDSSENLEMFKKFYESKGYYLFVPCVIKNGEPEPLFDYAIKKQDVILRKLSEIDPEDKTDFDHIIVTRSFANDSEDSSLNREESYSAEEITNIIAALEAKLATGDFEGDFDPIILDRLFTLERDDTGLVIPETVDPMLLTAAYQVSDQEWLKMCLRTPLKDIQKEYISILEMLLEPFKDFLDSSDVDESMVADFLASKKELVEDFEQRMPVISASINDFWDTYGAIVQFHIRNLHCTKGIFGGDSFPGTGSDLFNTANLVFDTLILPDPIQNAVNNESGITNKELFHIFIKQGLSATKYAPFVNLDIDFPMVVFVPSQRYNLSKFKHATDYLVDESDKDLIRHCNQLFNYDFKNIDDVKVFFEHSRTKEALLATINEPEYLLFNKEIAQDVDTQYDIAISETERCFPTHANNLGNNTIIMMNMMGRWLQLNTCLFYCDVYGGNPIMDAPTPWEYYQWKLKNYGKQATDNLTDSSSLAHLFYSKMLNISFKENINAQAIIRLKQSGMMNEMRGIIRTAVNNIEVSETSDIQSLCSGLEEELEKIMKKHKTEVSKLKKDGVIFSINATASLATKVIGAVGIATGNITLGLLSFAASEAGTPTVKELIKNGGNVRSQSSLLKRNPIGFFIGE